MGKHTEQNTLYLLIVGILLGWIQTGLFFTFTLNLSSGFTTYLLITLCWLAGSVPGIHYVSHRNFSLRLLVVFMLVVYVMGLWLINQFPHQSDWWWIYAVLTIFAGIYPGTFFARLSKTVTTRHLFLWENNGFILGLIFCTILFMLYGRIVLWLIPCLLASIVYMAS